MEFKYGNPLWSSHNFFFFNLGSGKDLQLDLGLNLKPVILKLCNIKSEGDDDRNNRDLGVLHALFVIVLRERYF